MTKQPKKPTEVLFAQQPLGRTLAYVGINRGSHAFHLHALGFFDAARALAQDILGGTRKTDVTIYPLLYLLRHGVELSLKQCAMSLGYSIERDHQALLKKLTKRRHSIADLWALISEIVRKDDWLAGEVEKPNDLDRVEDLLRQLDTLDPDGQAIRYPTGLNGQQNLETIEYVDVQGLSLMLDFLADRLETLSHHYWVDAEQRFYQREVEPLARAKASAPH